METKEFKYRLEERPPLMELLAFALQWFVITVPLVIILGKVGAGSLTEPTAQLGYMQKLFFATGISWLVQLLAGHKLPVIVGPASILLMGILANSGTETAAIYSSIAIGGVIVAVVAVFGLTSRIVSLFTTRIIGIVLLLIAFTLLPTILNLLVGGKQTSFAHLVFAGLLVVAMLAGQRYLPAFFKSTLIVWAVLTGTVAYYAFIDPLWPTWEIAPGYGGIGLSGLTWDFRFNMPVLVSFLFCFFALLANDLGSIQTTARLLGDREEDKRSRLGIFMTGVSNILAGALGVIGPVNYSLSTGVILSSRCASRYTMIPAAALMIMIAFAPALINAFSLVPSVVTGAVLFYMMCSQISGGLGLLTGDKAGFTFESGIVVGASLLTGTVIAFLPSQVLNTIPVLLRPILGNGFVVGIATALLLERLYGSGKVVR